LGPGATKMPNSLAEIITAESQLEFLSTHPGQIYACILT